MAQYNAKKKNFRWPIRHTVLESTHMDDTMDSVDHDEQCITNSCLYAKGIVDDK